MVTKPWSDSNGDSASKSHGDDVELIIEVVIMCSDTSSSNRFAGR